MRWGARPDGNGNTVAQTDPRDCTTHMTYDRAGGEPDHRTILSLRRLAPPRTAPRHRPPAIRGLPDLRDPRTSAEICGSLLRAMAMPHTAPNMVARPAERPHEARSLSDPDPRSTPPADTVLYGPDRDTRLSCNPAPSLQQAQ